MQRTVLIQRVRVVWSKEVHGYSNVQHVKQFSSKRLQLNLACSENVFVYPVSSKALRFYKTIKPIVLSSLISIMFNHFVDRFLNLRTAITAKHSNSLLPSSHLNKANVHNLFASQETDPAIQFKWNNINLTYFSNELCLLTDS